MTVLTLENITGRQRDAIRAILKEREFQDGKYGPVLEPAGYLGSGDKVPGCPQEQGRGGHELGAWLVILESELDEAKRALVHGGSKTGKGRDTIRAELVQVAAVALAALEQHGLGDTIAATDGGGVHTQPSATAAHIRNDDKGPL